MLTTDAWRKVVLTVQRNAPQTTYAAQSAENDTSTALSAILVPGAMFFVNPYIDVANVGMCEESGSRIHSDESAQDTKLVLYTKAKDQLAHAEWH